MDAGHEQEFYRVAPGCVVTIDLDPGIVVGDVFDNGDQVFTRVRMTDGSGSTRDLDPVAASEALADLLHLTAPTNGTDR
ncbi:hypothetical protein [Actinomadura sp. CNU-125]|uniref:hypothetical protein n=1 Tax=Actinomadura sp. CNU-125 TaxID=1904961 RepID=UPI0016520D08|nr:hypothetical protein [Actinomadura sp. CNU-125]